MALQLFSILRRKLTKYEQLLDNDLQTLASAIDNIPTPVTPTTVEVIITSSQILNMGTSPIEILPQPGVNKYYDIEQIVLEVDNANYTFGNNFQFEINKLLFYFGRESFVDSGNTIIFTGKNPQSSTVNSGVLVSRAQIANFSVKLTTSTGANPTGGTGKARVSITYTIREFGA